MIPIRGWVSLVGGSLKFRGVVNLDPERLASLPGGQKKVAIVEQWLLWRGGKVVVKGGS